MAQTPSTMLPLGTPLPEFSLTDTKTGKKVGTADVAERKALVVGFICNHCPYVMHIADELAKFGTDYAEKDVAILVVSANDAEKYPQDGPAEMKKEAKARGYVFPYLLDEDQSVAKAFRAACTPEFFVFNGNRKLVYRGQFDDSRPGNEKRVNGSDLRAAVDATLAGIAPSSDQKPSVGCNIKWKPGNEPDYFG